MKWACGLIIGEADSPDSTEKLVRAFRNCPFSAFVRVLRLPQEKGNVAPCGARCDRCELYETCPGCPAKVFYKGTSAGGEDVSG
jgi:hypothetical protein